MEECICLVALQASIVDVLLITVQLKLADRSYRSYWLCLKAQGDPHYGQQDMCCLSTNFAAWWHLACTLTGT